MKTVLVSGVKPTGAPHIGNYFGALRQMVVKQNEHESFVFIADLHALTTVHNAEHMQKGVFEIAATYLALGLNPERVTLFRQSDVPFVTELAWIFDCITTMPYLMRAHAFKDAQAKNKEINVGVFNYPVLMAADILIYDAHIVPVGKDQKQHVEIARDIAEKFNALFGETFMLPEAHTIESVETLPGTDGQKMSKSYNNVIPLFGAEEDILRAVMSIQTDSTPLGSPLDHKSDPVFFFHTLVSTDEELAELRAQYEAGSIGYGDSKKHLGEKMLEYFAPAREAYASLEKNPEKVYEILRRGGERARERAEKKMKTVRRAVGLS
jgi:tryptophanyl-tRNA synthetase